jgi:uncharacterized protein YbjT (DUF2867 family)
MRVLVTGAGGFIGHHLVRYLKRLGYEIRGADLKYPEYEASGAGEFSLLDLRRPEDCAVAVHNVEEVYALAANMGGMGFISSHHAQILRDNAFININTLEAARQAGVSRYLYYLIGLRLSRIPAAGSGGHAAARGRRVPGCAAGRLRVGEIDNRAALYSLPRRLRPCDPDCAVSQYFRAARHLGRRPRKGSGGDLPQGRDPQAER